jgi:hypothetical protein
MFDHKEGTLTKTVQEWMQDNASVENIGNKQVY